MKLVWNDGENAWICSECGAIYGEDEVRRVFNYDEQTAEHFIESYCMDCGCTWTTAEKN